MWQTRTFAVHPKNMILSVILILLVAFSGFALTYLFAEDEPFLWRLSAGNIVGASIFGLVAFVFANLFGLHASTVLIALAVTLLPLILFARKDIKKRFGRDWDKAKGKMQGSSYKKLLRFLYYLFFFALFWFFFERAMFETTEGIFTGGSNNLGDLPFHLGAIFGFTEGQNFPPQNPSFAGARFSYPFVADFLTACLVKIGVSAQTAIHVQNVSWAFSLLVVLERFVFKFTGKHQSRKNRARFTVFQRRTRFSVVCQRLLAGRAKFCRFYLEHSARLHDSRSKISLGKHLNDAFYHAEKPFARNAADGDCPAKNLGNFQRGR